MRERRTTWLARALRAVGLQRLRPRPTHARNTWAGGAVNRLTLDWVMSPTSIDQEVRSNLRTLRARARKLRVEDAYAARFVQLQVENIVGAAGIGLQLRAGTTRGALTEELRDEIEHAWRDWQLPEHASVDGRHSFAEIQKLAVAQWKTDGEALVVLHEGFPNKYGFALQLVDPDQLDDDYNVSGAPGQNEVRMGVELDQWGRRVAFHILTEHPNDLWGRNRERQRIPADRVRHLYSAIRPGQTRGVSSLAPVLIELQMNRGLEEALLVLLRTTACKMGFLEVDPELTDSLEPDPEEEDVTGAAKPVISWDAEPARIEQLPKGMSFKPWDPGQPAPEHDAFARRVQRRVAMGLGVSYASLSGDQSQANFGSQRVAMTSERDGYADGQSLLTQHLILPVFRRWLGMAGLARQVRIPGFDVDAIVAAAEAQPRGFDWIDPEKDANANLKEVGAGIQSLTRIAASKGRDIETVLRERKAEEDLAKKIGVTITLSPTGTPAAPTNPPVEEDQGETGRHLLLKRAANG
jgi:lambda family phage portal protein